ncbi:unnamed protein product, partial [Rotaria socialis]
MNPLSKILNGNATTPLMPSTGPKSILPVSDWRSGVWEPPYPRIHQGISSTSILYHSIFR